MNRREALKVLAVAPLIPGVLAAAEPVPDAIVLAEGIPNAVGWRIYTFQYANPPSKEEAIAIFQRAFANTPPGPLGPIVLPPS